MTGRNPRSSAILCLVMSAFVKPTRSSVTTISTDGSRPFLFPADVRGRFAKARKASALALIAFYLSLPWIQIGGAPAVFIDVAERRFHLFGVTLAAQDLWLFFFVLTGLGFSLFFVTALLGRVWCGWACPQTVFLDHVYRPIERWIDGDAVQRRALHHAPLSAAKVVRRVVKHTIYILVSAVITHLFLAYYISIPQLWEMMEEAPTKHWDAFVFVAVATGILYFNYAWFREQLCLVICPYGRLQSALIDDHSLVIGYDAFRGEPRGKGAKAVQTGSDVADQTAAVAALAGGQAASSVSILEPASFTRTGDCVDCIRCVQVCPTGIDIRQGLQMECIGCTACIDACDEVMTRLHRPRGLIRYDSQIAFSAGKTRWLRPRTILYGVLLAIGVSVATWALSTVKPAHFGVTRMTGAPYVIDDASVRNQFLVRIVNKQSQRARFVLELENLPPGVRQVGFETIVEIAPMAEVVQPLVVQQSRDSYSGPFKFNVHVEDAAGRYQIQRVAEFLGPEARLLRAEQIKK
jgi:polyferredoxin